MRKIELELKLELVDVSMDSDLEFIPKLIKSYLTEKNFPKKFSRQMKDHIVSWNIVSDTEATETVSKTKDLKQGGAIEFDSLEDLVKMGI